ncbi:MAG: hypothetical protein Fur0037_01330 [Planctomycetota bacterium]
MESDESIRRLLAERTRFSAFEHLASCPSTQDVAATVGECNIIWADHQTEGRGRRDRAWVDAPGLDVLVTFGVRGFTPRDPLALPAVLPIAVARTLEPRAGRPIRVKWPNDVHLDGRKIAGLLIDAPGEDPGCFLIGVGINVNRTEFPRELADSATSLALARGQDFDRGQLVLDLALRVEEALGAVESGNLGDWAREFSSRLALIGRRVTVLARGLQHHGRIARVDLEGIALEEGPSFSLGEVQRILVD